MQTPRLPRLAVLLTCLASCQSYRPQPLEPEKILELAKARRATAPRESLTLSTAHALLLERNPRVREAQAAFRRARALADVATPLGNPTLDAGPLLFRGGASGAEGAIGWAIPLGGRRRITDDRNRIAAQLAEAEAARVAREEYLALRREFAQLALATRRVAAHEEVVAAARALVSLTEGLAKGASATALDVLDVRLDALRAEAALLAANEAEEEARGAFAARIGLSARHGGSGGLPILLAEVPGLDSLEALLLRHHSGLAVGRARYDLAEVELRLEVARQYPALSLGGSFEDGDGSGQFGLLLGIELPVFDRNQQGIAEARAHREEVRVGFETKAERALAALEAAHLRLLARQRQWALVRDQVLPAAAEAFAAGRRSLEAGVIEPQRFLALLRSEREARLGGEEALGQYMAAWFDLCDVTGAPVFFFPDEVPKW